MKKSLFSVCQNDGDAPTEETAVAAAETPETGMNENSAEAEGFYL